MAAGTFTLLLGATMMVFWAYSWFVGGPSAPSAGTTQVIFGMATGALVAGAGAGMLGRSARTPALFIAALGALSIATVLSFAVYGTGGNALLMNGVAIGLMVVFSYFITLAYGWEHFVLHLDEPGQAEPRSKKKAA